MAIITEKYTKDRQLSPHFALHEFKCKSGATTVKWCEETVALLEKIFTKCSKVNKAIIESGYRTPEYSVKVGGTKGDGHTVGIAVDVKWYDRQNHIIPPKYIACIAQEVGFTGIGVMKNSIHLDTRTTKNYTNGKWWGDETTGKNGIKDFFAYFGLTREAVYKFLGVAVEQKAEEKVESKKEEVTNPVEVLPKEPKSETVPEATQVIKVKKELEIETPKTDEATVKKDEEVISVDSIIEYPTPEVKNALITLIKFVAELIKKIFNKEK